MSKIKLSFGTKIELGPSFGTTSKNLELGSNWKTYRQLIVGFGPSYPKPSLICKIEIGTII
jgi:hypothetical protein